MPPRKGFVHTAVMAGIPSRRRSRDAILSFIDSLGERAHPGGGYQEADPETGRKFEVTIIGGLALHWWVDDPVNETKIVQSRRADRG